MLWLSRSFGATRLLSFRLVARMRAGRWRTRQHRSSRPRQADEQRKTDDQQQPLHRDLLACGMDQLRVPRDLAHQLIHRDRRAVNPPKARLSMRATSKHARASGYRCGYTLRLTISATSPTPVACSPTRFRVSAYRGSRRSPDVGTSLPDRHFWRHQGGDPDASQAVRLEALAVHRSHASDNRARGRCPLQAELGPIGTGRKGEDAHASQGLLLPRRAGHPGHGRGRRLQARVTLKPFTNEALGPLGRLLPSDREGFVVGKTVPWAKT